MTQRDILKPQSEPQWRFLASPADIAIYGGAAGGGKTWGLLVEPLRHRKNTEFGGVVFRRTAAQIHNEGGLWDRSEEIYPHIGGEATALRWTFPAESSITMAHLQLEKHLYDWDGSQIPYIGFDELIHFTEKQFFYMLSRNRSMCGVKPYVRATTNPDAESWVADLIQWWWDEETGYPIPERSGQIRWFYRVNSELRWYATMKSAAKANPALARRGIRPKSLTFIPAQVYDNPVLLERNPEYLGSLYALPNIERQRLLEGNWLVRATAGEVFDRAWFPLVRAAPAEGKVVRYWDKAGTEGGGSHTSGVRMKKTPAGEYYIEDVVMGQWSALKRERMIKNIAQQDGENVVIVVEEEGGSGGKESAEATIRNLSGFKAYSDRVTGDKIERALPMSAQAEAGNIKVVDASWTKRYLEILHNFEPDAAIKDPVDASSGAFNWLNRRAKKRAGVIG